VTELQTWAARWGDLASIAGLLLSVVGFAVTIVSVRRARSAAEQARQAAVEARESIAHYDAIADLSAAIAIMEETKRLQRQSGWPVLLDRYSEIRHRLGAISGSRAALANSQRQTLTSFRELERVVERAVADPTDRPDVVTINSKVSRHIDEMHDILLSLQRALRSEP